MNHILLTHILVLYNHKIWFGLTFGIFTQLVKVKVCLDNQRSLRVYVNMFK